MFSIELESGKEIFLSMKEINDALAIIISDSKKFEDINVEKDDLIKILSICLNSMYVSNLIYKLYDDEIAQFFSKKYDA